MSEIDLSKVTSDQLKDELDARGEGATLAYATNEDLIDELDDRGYDVAPLYECGDTGTNLRDDLEFCRDMLLQHRPADALAMLERLLFPNDPKAAAAKYANACANRDPATGRPVIA